MNVLLDEVAGPDEADDEPSWFVARPSSEIDEDGFYELEGLPPGDLHLVTEGDPELSESDGEAWVGDLAAGALRDGVDFWLPDPLARIQLRLVDTAGRPLAGERARWIALDPDPWDGDDAESDEEGRITWEISRGPPLDIKRIWGTGLVPLVASLPRDGPERVIVCEPTPTHRLRVHVEDETGTTVIPKWVIAGALDRERQASEHVPGAFIEPTADLAELVVRADPPFRVGAGMEGGWVEGQVEVHALPPDGIVRVVVREHDRIRGSVTWENGLPVSGVDVCFTEEGGSGCVAHARTDAQGRFDMQAPAGRTKGRLTALMRAGAFSARLEAHSADARERTDWVLHRTAWVTGEVHAPDGECVPPTVVWAGWGERGGLFDEHSYSARTDIRANGRFVLPIVPPELEIDVGINAMQDLAPLGWVCTPTTVTVLPGGHAVFTLQKGETIAGRVVAKDGTGKPGTYVRAIPHDPAAPHGSETTAGPDGEFTLCGLAPGRYTLAAGEAGERGAWSLAVAQAGDAGVEMSWPEPAAVTPRFAGSFYASRTTPPDGGRRSDDLLQVWSTGALLPLGEMPAILYDSMACWAGTPYDLTYRGELGPQIAAQRNVPAGERRMLECVSGAPLAGRLVLERPIAWHACIVARSPSAQHVFTLSRLHTFGDLVCYKHNELYDIVLVEAFVNETVLARGIRPGTTSLELVVRRER
ncbi:MAG: carboxypeptidase-like regulatory domain-containing protein [Planctomycetota bacterium]